MSLSDRQHLAIKRARTASIHELTGTQKKQGAVFHGERKNITRATKNLKSLKKYKNGIADMCKK